jgi:GDP-mannose 6-dehydrogenase
VGSVSAACFAKEGHSVVGVDVSAIKVETIRGGKSPIVEPGLEDLIAEMVAAGRLQATVDSAAAIAASDVSLICVGTPSRPNGSLDLTYVQSVCHEIGAALGKKRSHHTVVVRSTMLPGTVDTVVIPALEACSGLKAGRDFSVCINPEFLRESTSLKDFYSPPFTLVGAPEESMAEPLRELYQGVTAPFLVTSVRAAEMVKYACNSFHALKVAFANEIGSVCKSMEIDSHEVMQVFCQDTKLNLSSYYLKPGFAFGGSCLPKDVRALAFRARETDVIAPVLSAILESNRHQVERAVDMVLRTRKKRIGLLGLSFKSGTDDLRESPLVTLAERLLGKGMQIAIYDRDVSLSSLVGANRHYIETEIPHISQLLRTDIQEVVDQSDVIILGKKAPEFQDIESRIRTGQIVIDIARVMEGRMSTDGYEGICW